MVALNGTGTEGTPVNGFRMLATGEPLQTRPALQPLQPRPALQPLQPMAPWGATAADDLEQETSRLENEIAAAKERAAAARQRTAARDADVREALRAELAASKDVLTEMDRAHEVTVAMIREAAHSEVVRIMADARRHMVERSTEVGGAEQEEVRSDVE
jgi:hypothetical protein